MPISNTARKAVVDALEGKRGRDKPMPGDPLYLDPPTRKVLEDLTFNAGVQGTDALVYVARRLRYLLAGGDAPTPPGALLGPIGAWVDQRAARMIDENRDRLPAPRHEVQIARALA